MLSKNEKKQFYQEHRDRILEAVRKRYNEDINFKLHSSLRRVRYNLRSGKKCMELLACSSDFMMDWFEFCFDYKNKKYQTEYSFDNYGEYWHIDHVIPCSLFDPLNETHKKICYHWSNLSPLICSENQSKSNNFDVLAIEEHMTILKLFINKNETQTSTIFDMIVEGALTTAGLLKDKSQHLEEISKRW